MTFVAIDHVQLVMPGGEGLEELSERLRQAGHEVIFDGDLPGFRRFYVSDPFGDRLEFLEPVGDGPAARPWS